MSRKIEDVFVPGFEEWVLVYEKKRAMIEADLDARGASADERAEAFIRLSIDEMKTIDDGRVGKILRPLIELLETGQRMS